MLLPRTDAARIEAGNPGSVRSRHGQSCDLYLAGTLLSEREARKWRIDSIKAPDVLTYRLGDLLNTVFPISGNEHQATDRPSDRILPTVLHIAEDHHRYQDHIQDSLCDDDCHGVVFLIRSPRTLCLMEYSDDLSVEPVEHIRSTGSAIHRVGSRFKNPFDLPSSDLVWRRARDEYSDRLVSSKHRRAVSKKVCAVGYLAA